MRKRKHLLVLLLTLLAMPIWGQQRLKFSIANFELDPFDQTATNKAYEKIDGSGARYSIIKVTSDNPDDDLRAFNFNFGNLRHEVKERDGELWVYVQKNAKIVTITREGYNPVNRHALPVTIGEGKVYVMQLSVQEREVKHRILQFKVTPANEGAIVKVKREDSGGDYELWGAVDAAGGKAQRLETGVVYLYEITAEHYDKTMGRIVLTYADENYVEAVTLKPNFGYLEVADEHGIAGAEIYVNDKKLGIIPCKERLDVGTGHRVMIASELYKTYSTTVDIRKGETTRIAPQLESNFAETTITVPDSAEIFIEGTSRGRGKWTGPLKAGIYTVECRRGDSYRPSRRQITIKPNEAETFTMDAPTPILSSIFVNSTPLGATIQIDGNEVGKTPKEVRDILIGQHSVRVLYEGLRPEEKMVEVTEGKTTEVAFQLHDEARFTIKSEPQTRLILDGKDVGLTPYSFEGSSGDYDILLECRRYKTYHQKTALRASAPEQTFRLQRLYQLPTSFYLGAGFQAGTLMGGNAHVGAYISNINIEAYGTMGIAKETVFLNSTLDGYESLEDNLKATLLGGRVGYGIIVGSKLRFTPQVGAASLTVKGDEMTATALCATVGCRVDYALTSFLGINLTPEGQFAVSKKDVFTQISDFSSKVKGWGTGAGVRLGLYLYF